MGGHKWMLPQSLLATLSISLCVLVTALYVLFSGPAVRGDLHASSVGGLHARSPNLWRNNSYIRDDGLLPFQRCGAEDFYPGASRSYDRFMHDGEEHLIAATAISVFGASDQDGRPTEAPALAELLVYFQGPRGCRIISSLHCATELIRPLVQCRVRGSTEWLAGAADYLNATITARVQPFEWIALSSLTCPLGPGHDLKDAFEIEWRVGGDAAGAGSAAFSTEVCYQHVQEPTMLVVCTQPHYGFDARSTFWMGSPPYAHGTLVDAFVLYYAKVMGVSVVFNDLGSSFAPELVRYSSSTISGGSGRVKYRSDWELAQYFPGIAVGGTAEHEIFAEATCMWEHRISARWHMQGVSADNFLLPMVADKNIVDLLSLVDASSFSELAVPFLTGHSKETSLELRQQQNVLQRYSLLGPELHYRSYAPGDWATTPIANPRHHQFGVIHWMEYGKKPTVGLPVMSPSDVLHKIGLQTLHLHVLSGRDDEHTGSSFSGLTASGAKLEEELSHLPPVPSPSPSCSSTPSSSPSPLPPAKLTAESWGRLGNKLLQAMGQHLLAKKYNLQTIYFGNGAHLKQLGLELWNGTGLMTGGELVVNDSNFQALAVSSNNSLSVRLVIPGSTYLQLPYLAKLIRSTILPPASASLLQANSWKHRLHSNNDTFVHVRLGDLVQSRPTVNHFATPIELHLEGQLYISSDSPEDPIVHGIASRFNGTILALDEVQTWQFAAMCKHVVIHDGTFSWWAGAFASVFGATVSHVLRPDHRWSGDIYVFDDWQPFAAYP